MRKLLVVLYTALILGANPGVAEVASLLDGDMKKLMLWDAPVAVPEAVLLDATDGEHALADYKGKWVVLNFWATWCAPCRREMPSLDRLQAAMPELPWCRWPRAQRGRGDQRFFDEAGVTTLPILRDPTSDLGPCDGGHGPAGDGDPEPRRARGRPADRRCRMGQRQRQGGAEGIGKGTLGGRDWRSVCPAYDKYGHGCGGPCSTAQGRYLAASCTGLGFPLLPRHLPFQLRWAGPKCARLWLGLAIT
jgi:hypothetical protein